MRCKVLVNFVPWIIMVPSVDLCYHHCLEHRNFQPIHANQTLIVFYPTYEHICCTSTLKLKQTKKKSNMLFNQPKPTNILEHGKCWNGIDVARELPKKKKLTVVYCRTHRLHPCNCSRLCRTNLEAHTPRFTSCFTWVRIVEDSTFPAIHSILIVTNVEKRPYYAGSGLQNSQR